MGTKSKSGPGAGGTLPGGANKSNGLIHTRTTETTKRVNSLFMIKGLKGLQSYCNLLTRQ